MLFLSLTKKDKKEIKQKDMEKKVGNERKRRNETEMRNKKEEKEMAEMEKNIKDYAWKTRNSSLSKRRYSASNDHFSFRTLRM